MKNSFLLLCGIALLALVGWTSYGQRQNPGKATWEYVVKSDHSLYAQYTDLRPLGLEGWELVAVTTHDHMVGNQLDVETNYYFKRQK
jgi:hypothetical protein